MQVEASSSKPLHRMFTAVPPRYDLINRIVTLGMDQRWRFKAAEACVAGKPERVLDVGCGTGDLAINIAGLSQGNPEMFALDFSEPMLEIARVKAQGIPRGKKITFIYGDVSRLPFPESYFDCVGISFAFRNLTYQNPKTKLYLAEILRVLKPGGEFVIVESSQPRSAVVRALFHLYLRAFVYPAGYLLSGNKGAYRYLAESAARFYGPDGLRQLLCDAGFGAVRCRQMFFGAAGLYTAVKL